MTDPTTTRRQLLYGGAIGATAAIAGCTDSGDGGGGGDGPAATVTVGPNASLSFDPQEVTVSTGETVRWEWDSSGHNVAPTSVPEGADWEGVGDLEDVDYEYEHTFEVAGTYEYECSPHAGQGMVGTVVVEE